MKKVSLARKYTKALTETISDMAEYERIRSEIESFTGFIAQDEKLRSGLETVLFSYSQKVQVLSIFSREAGLSEKTRNFLTALIEKNRISYLPMVLEMIEDLWYESKGIEKFELFSAVEIDPAQEERLRLRLKNALKKEVVLKKKTDPSLLAGIKLKKGSIFYDFSIEGNLKKLRESLIGDDSI